MEYESAKPKQQNVWRPKENTHSHFELQHITYYTISLEITDRLAWKYLGNVFDFESPFLYCLFKSMALLNCNHEHRFEFRNQEGKLFKIILEYNNPSKLQDLIAPSKQMNHQSKLASALLS